MDKWYCAACGSEHVQTRMWVNPNNMQIDPHLCMMPNNEEENFCLDCQEPTILKTIEELWDNFSEIDIDNDDNITEPFLDFEVGTSRFDIWHWFDERCPNGVVKDLIGE